MSRPPTPERIEAEAAARAATLPPMTDEQVQAVAHLLALGHLDRGEAES